jgi:hypothetical protein
MTCHRVAVAAVLCVCVLGSAFSGTARAAEVVIDFQGLTHAGADPSYVRTWEEQGFSLTNSIDPVLQDTAFAAWGTGSPDFPGSTALFAVFPSLITLERSDGEAFAARGISMAPLSASFPTPATVIFVGELAHGGFVMQGVTFSSSISLQPFSFDPTFTDLVALRWRQSDIAPHQFDDIRVAPIPEPATVLSLVCGLLALAALHSRRRYRWGTSAAPRPI